MRRSVSKRFAWAVYILLFMFFGVAMAGTEVGSFTAPLGISLGGTGLTATPTDGQLLVGKTSTNAYVQATLTGTSNQVTVTNGSGTITLSTPQNIAAASDVTFNSAVLSANTAKSFLYSDASSKVVATSAPTNGQLLIGSTGNIPVAAALTQGTGITVTNAAGSITIAANGAGTKTVTSKTTNYTVVSGDSGTFFDNTAASAEVDFTLPTASAGLYFSFYVDAVQTVKLIAGSSTTIRLGGSVSAAAGNITNAVAGGCVTIIAISSTQWVAIGYTGTWTVT